MAVVSYMWEKGLTKMWEKEKSTFVQARQAALHVVSLGSIFANKSFEF